MQGIELGFAFLELIPFLFSRLDDAEAAVTMSAVFNVNCQVSVKAASLIFIARVMLKHILDALTPAMARVKVLHTPKQLSNGICFSKVFNPGADELSFTFKPVIFMQHELAVSGNELLHV